MKTFNYFLFKASQPCLQIATHLIIPHYDHVHNWSATVGNHACIKTTILFFVVYYYSCTVSVSSGEWYLGATNPPEVLKLMNDKLKIVASLFTVGCCHCVLDRKKNIIQHILICPFNFCVCYRDLFLVSTFVDIYIMNSLAKINLSDSTYKLTLYDVINADDVINSQDQ